MWPKNEVILALQVPARRKFRNFQNKRNVSFFTLFVCFSEESYESRRLEKSRFGLVLVQQDWSCTCSFIF